MSSDWQPPRTPLFGIALIPPQPAGAGPREDLLPSPAAPHEQPDAAGAAPPPQHVCRAESAGWTAAAVSSLAPVAIAIVAGQETALWPWKWLHPAERQTLDTLPPPARRQALAVLTAARRALVEALALPEPAAACLDLSPLLDGVQSLRFGDWTLQRVPAPAGCCVFAAAPGAGWSYFLLQEPAPCRP